MKKIIKINYKCTCQYVVLNWCVFCSLLLRVIVKQIWKQCMIRQYFFSFYTKIEKEKIKF